MGPAYCSREDVLTAADTNESLRAYAQVDRLIYAASRRVEQQMHRRFYPELDTRYLDWPDDQLGTAYRLYLDGTHELISVTSIVSGGRTITSYFLEPQSSGPPYTRLEIDQASVGSFSSGGTWQRDVAITGVYGACADEDTAATTLASLAGSGDTQITVANGAAVDVLDTIRIDTERLTVTDRAWTTSGQTLGGSGVTAGKADNVFPVASGAAFNPGESLLVDAERVLITDIAGNSLIVARGQNGTTLAAHTTGATLYASRLLTVTRGVLGTTAAAHSSAAPVAVHRVPAPIRELAIAETLVALDAEQGAYARTGRSLGNTGTGQPKIPTPITDLREEAFKAYGRQARNRSV